MYKKLIFSGFLFLVLSCTTTRLTMLGPVPYVTPDISTFTDIAFFENSQNCELPCWQGLMPGLSTSEDVETYFNNNVSYLPDAFMTSLDEYDVSLSNGVHSDGYQIFIYQRDEALLDIQLVGQFDLTYKDITSNLNNPPYVDLRAQSNGTGYTIFLTLFYPESGYVFEFMQGLGMEINLIDQTNMEICTTEDMYVGTIHIVESGQIQTSLSGIQPAMFTYFDDELINEYINQLSTDFELGCHIVEIQ